MCGRTVGESIAGAEVLNEDVIRRRERPLDAGGSLVVLGGSLCPDGAVMKISAAADRLLDHEGRAVVFEGNEDLAARIDDPALDVDADSVLVLRNGGPVGAPGMPEWGHLPIPAKLLKAGVKDMLRISDARMSGTSYGAVVLHVAPESAVGGPLALAETGDRSGWTWTSGGSTWSSTRPSSPAARGVVSARPADLRGYRRLYAERVLQANEGCDFDFLRGRSPVVEESTTYLA